MASRQSWKVTGKAGREEKVMTGIVDRKPVKRNSREDRQGGDREFSKAGRQGSRAG